MLFEQFVFADISSDVFANLSRGQQQPVAQTVHSDVVADRRKILHPFANQGANQVFGDSAQPESANHDGGAIENILDGFVGAGHNLIHM